MQYEISERTPRWSAAGTSAERQHRPAERPDTVTQALHQTASVRQLAAFSADLNARSPRTSDAPSLAPAPASQSGRVAQLRLDPDPAGNPGRYIHVPDDGTAADYPYYTHYGYNSFQTHDGAWWSYLPNQDRFVPKRAPRHVGGPQPYARPARGGYNMRNRADEATPFNSLLAVSDRAYGQEFGSGIFAQGPFQERPAEFSARRANPANRRDLGRVAAKSMGEKGRVSANELAGRHMSSMQNDGVNREYLHQQSHGGGGRDVMGNIGVGSAGANTEMIPIESAVNGRKDLRMQVLFEFYAGTPVLARVTMHILRADNGQVVWTQVIDAQQRIFTREQYDTLRSWVGFVVDPANLEQLVEFGLTDPRELAWLQFLTPDCKGGGPFDGPGKGPGGGSGGGSGGGPGFGGGGGNGFGNSGPMPMDVST